MDFPGILVIRVPLVEDNPILSRSLTGALTSAKLTVDCMHDGESADHVARVHGALIALSDAPGGGLVVSVQCPALKAA
ncbi:hypothetical protein [Paraburkholderia sediminicola]|uniref:hypothetical protein n=1 Tax=Paraburkholderia sediminicola TaxID=458836 RepID=UPI0038B8B420